jgi:hypothetical protein
MTTLGPLEEVAQVPRYLGTLSKFACEEPQKARIRVAVLQAFIYLDLQERELKRRRRVENSGIICEEPDSLEGSRHSKKTWHYAVVILRTMRRQALQ